MTGMWMATAMCALSGALGLGVEASGGETSAQAADMTAPAEVRQTYARVILTIGDQTYAHPGFFAYLGEESVFNFDIGGKVHQVAVGITGDEEKGYELNIVYKIGARLVLSGSGHTAAGKSVVLTKGKTKVEVLVDPHGQIDKKRRDKIKGPGSEDPLG